MTASDHLHRRPVVSPSGPKGVDANVQRSMSAAQQLGIHRQEGKVLNNATPISCLSRRTSELSEHDNGSTSRKTAGLAMRSPGIEEKENVHHQRNVIDIRSNDPCVQDRRGDCPHALPGIATAAHPIPSQIWHAGPEKADHSDCRKSVKLTVVDISQTSARKQHSDSGTCFQHYNPSRCITSSVGSSVSRHENWRPLEQRRATSSHKLSGTESGLSGHSILSESMSTDRESYSSTNGQHDGCGIYQQTRRNEIEQVKTVRLGDMERMSVQEDNSDITAPTRNSEHRRRCRVETDKHQDRMDTRQITVRKYPEMLP